LCVDWSGGGTPDSNEGMCSFTTHWSTAGEKTVTATPECGSSKQKTVGVEYPLTEDVAWTEYTNPDIPGSCGGICDGEDATEFDDCGNELEVSCSQADGTGGTSDCAYRCFYNDNLISSCIWDNGDNHWWYKKATIGDSGLKIFTKIRHSTGDPDKFDDEGCDGYYCTLVTIYDCQTGGKTEYWRRDDEFQPVYEWDGEEHECAGP